MDLRKIAVIVEDVEVARTALKWALNNLLRYGDFITLLHVFPPATSKLRRHLRLSGYQLALNFKQLCAAFPHDMLQTKVEIIVTEGDGEGRAIAAMVREIGASVLVVGLHHHSFLYKVAMAQDDLARTFNCKVVAIKQATAPAEYSQKTKNVEVIAAMDSSINLGFSQIEIAKLEAPGIVPRKIPYRIFPDPSAIIWRWKNSRRMAMAQDDLARTFSCKVVAMKQATASTEYSQNTKNMEVIAAMDSSMGFSQMEIAKLEAPGIVPRKIPYRIFPDPSAIIWRWKKSSRLTL